MASDPSLRARVRPPKTAELIAAQIRGQIVRGEIEPGANLATESELMLQFGVSRPTLREAYRILEAESLIQVRRGVGGGALVAAPESAVGARYVGLLLQYGGATIADVYEARTMLESICAGMSASRKEPGSIAALSNCMESAAKLIEVSPSGVPDAGAWQRTTYEFHLLVLRGSGNKTLALQGELLQEVVAMHYAASTPSSFDEGRGPDPFRRVLRSFKKLLSLIEDGDTEGASAHWERHMQKGKVALLGDDIKNKRIVDLFRVVEYFS